MSKKRNKKHQNKKAKPVTSGKLLQLKETDVLDGMKSFEKIGEGKGKFTVVYSAEKKAGDKVALKLFVCTNPGQKKLRYEKFKNEAAILKMLEDHPHILKSHDSRAKAEGKHNGQKVQVDYFTMELLAGSLTDHIEDLQANQVTWGIESKLNVLIQICQALEHAHSRKIYHRDLYADNILLVDFNEPLTAKLTDFGAAKAAAIKSSTVYHHPVGALIISSPEMLAGLATDKDTLIKSDVFSLGLLLYSVMMESPHVLENRLLNAPRPTNPSMTKAQREEFLALSVIPYLQAVAYQPIILVGTMTNKTDVERSLNKLVSDATTLEFQQRLAEIKDVRKELERCRDLINA